MSNIACKLSYNIVEPLNPSERSEKISNARNKIKPRQILQYDKKYVKVLPYNKTDSAKNKVKFIEKGIKTKSVNSAVNTLSSSNLSNNSVTLIDKRNHQKGICKEIQTICKKNYIISDNSCTNCIKTVSCGTQFIDNINGILKYRQNKVAIQINDSKETYKLRRKQPLSIDDNLKIYIEKPHMMKPPSLRYVDAKFWALSGYPTRGPDF